MTSTRLHIDAVPLGYPARSALARIDLMLRMGVSPTRVTDTVRRLPGVTPDERKALMSHVADVILHR